MAVAALEIFVLVKYEKKRKQESRADLNKTVTDS